MHLREGDVIGTVDGRYGKIVFLVTQENFLVKEAIDPDDPCDTEPEEFWTGRSNVESVV